MIGGSCAPEEKGQDRSGLLRVAPSLGGGYIELICLDADGEPAADKRVLFPT